MIILSLFDGISCARVALERAGIAVESYFSSEIDRYAMQVSHKNYPDIIQMGDVKDVKFLGGQASFCDLLIGGSPCQDLSIAKRGRTGLAGDKSSLFYEFVRILEATKPKYFVLENVNSMHREARDLITKTLGVEPIVINAGLVSAQHRERLFWTNIPNVVLPADRQLFLENVLEEKGIDITARVLAKVKGTLSFKKTWSNMRTPKQKAKTLTASGQNLSNTGATNVDMGGGMYRKLTPIECERLQGLPDGYTEGVSSSQRYKTLGNAFNVDVVAHILSFIPKQNELPLPMTDTEKQFWLTPPEIYKELDDEFHFDFDPCPYPYQGVDGTEIDWGKSNYVNPPFRKADGQNGKGPTAFVRKAIEEFKKGKESVLMLPVQSYVNLLLEAGAEVRSMKRVKWVSGKTGEVWKMPTSIALFVLKKKK